MKSLYKTKEIEGSKTSYELGVGGIDKKTYFDFQRIAKRECIEDYQLLAMAIDLVVALEDSIYKGNIYFGTSQDGVTISEPFTNWFPNTVSKILNDRAEEKLRNLGTMVAEAKDESSGIIRSD